MATLNRIFFDVWLEEIPSLRSEFFKVCTRKILLLQTSKTNDSVKVEVDMIFAAEGQCWL